MLARKPVLSVPEGGVDSVAGRDAGAPSNKALWAPSSGDRSFAALDAFLAGWTEGNAFCVVVSPTPASTSAVAEHVARRMAGRAVATTRAFGGPAQEGFRELARVLSSSSASERSPLSLRESPNGLLSSREVAATVMQAASGGDSRAAGGWGPEGSARSCFVVEDGSPSRYGLAVATELDAGLAGASDGTAPCAVVWIVTARESGALERLLPAMPHAQGFAVDSELDPASLAAYWAGAQTLPVVEGVSLDHLARWWRASRRALLAEAQAGAESPDAAARADVDRILTEVAEPAARLARTLGLVGRPLPVRAAQRLPGGTHLHELERVGLIEADAGRVAVSPVLADLRAALPISADEEQAALGALLSVFADDPWACMRAAEIGYATGSAPARSDDHALRALTAAVDADSRIDLWARFDEARFELEPRSGAASKDAGLPKDAERLLPFVDLALRKGDGDWALRLARRAVASGSPASNADLTSSTVLLYLGRALAMSGDLTSASITLEKVTQAACEGAEQRLIAARACVELAEARYYASDLARARAAAEDAMVRLTALLEGEDVPTVATRCGIIRLDARNVLGKLLLAQADFVGAEHHFAADAFEASLVAEPVGELRARVNRAIAVMSLGRRAEAQGILESVLDEAERANELKATGMCLINLAALAISDRRYGEALDLSERAVEVLRRIGDKVALSRCVANLAELRTRMGLLEEAAQAVRFGSRVLQGRMPLEQGARFALVLARVALGKGDTGGAQRHVTQALATLGVTVSSDEDSSGKPRGPVAEHVAEALQLGARIALEDGDTARARVLLERAEKERSPRRARTELAVLRALLARAVGARFDELAAEALRQARELDDDELLREAHLVAYRSALSEGATSAARHHLTAALALRARVAENVPLALQGAFLKRRDMVELEHEAARFGRLAAPEQDALDTGAAQDALSTASTAGPVGVAPSADVARLVRPLPPAAFGARRIVGDDPAVRAMLHAVRKVGPSETTVLIHGESGTGKELVAEALHEASARKAGPLVKVNCAALVETLLLSELFGHEKGAFTGAAGRRRGRFEAAEGGTLFLDEIGDISGRTQVALLRVLQEKTFERVGGTTSIRANVRVVCATHRNLKQLVARGEFREDLYYRLCGVTVEVPALRARLADLAALCDAILRRIADERGTGVKRLSPAALVALKSHTWPGNIRELENGLRAASLFAESDVLEPHDFADNVDSLRHIAETVESFGAIGRGSEAPAESAVQGDGPETARAAGMRSAPSIGAPSATVTPDEPPVSQAVSISQALSQGVSISQAPISQGSSAPAASVPGCTPSEVAYAQVRSGVSLHDMKRLIERECIVRALADAGGNITRAATLLGMKRPRLSQLVKQYGLGGGDASEDAGEVGQSNEEDE